MDKHEYDFDDAKLRRRLRGFVSAITERKIQEMLLKGLGALHLPSPRADK